MNILVFNCGSSSLNYKVFRQDGNSLDVLCSGKAHRVGVKGSEPAFIEHQKGDSHSQVQATIENHRDAARLVLDYLTDQCIQVDAVGHRFVHGGSYFRQSAWLTDANLADLQTCLPLASIHNPNSMSVIEVCKQALPDIPQYLTFDTAFHASLPESSYAYLLPIEIIEKYGYRKYGFHGLSYQFVIQQVGEYLGRPVGELNIIACHLGTGGSSVAAVRGGKSLDTTMGFTPLAGLMMSTRTGDLDPNLVLTLLEETGLSADQLDAFLNKKSGLLGISGFSSDLRDIIARMDQEQDERSRLAFEMYTYRLKKTIGALAVELGKVDVLIFTDDIGLTNWRVRQQTCCEMSWCGIELDEDVNRKTETDRINLISAAHSRVKVLAMPTNEELVIGQEGFRLLEEGGL